MTTPEIVNNNLPDHLYFLNNLHTEVGECSFKRLQEHTQPLVLGQVPSHTILITGEPGTGKTATLNALRTHYSGLRDNDSSQPILHVRLNTFDKARQIGWLNKDQDLELQDWQDTNRVLMQRLSTPNDYPMPILNLVEVPGISALATEDSTKVRDRGVSFLRACANSKFPLSVLSVSANFQIKNQTRLVRTGEDLGSIYKLLGLWLDKTPDQSDVNQNIIALKNNIAVMAKPDHMRQIELEIDDHLEAFVTFLASRHPTELLDLVIENVNSGSGEPKMEDLHDRLILLWKLHHHMSLGFKSEQIITAFNEYNPDFRTYGLG